jgi:hypothetical protein
MNVSRYVSPLYGQQHEKIVRSLRTRTWELNMFQVPAASNLLSSPMKRQVINGLNAYFPATVCSRGPYVHLL